jgi:biopolymer transport protein ExbB
MTAIPPAPRFLIGTFAILALCGLFARAGAQQADAPPAADSPSASPTNAEPGGSGQPPTAEAGSSATKPGVDRGTIFRVFRANPMLWPLLFCSVFTVGIALERWLALRKKRIVPDEFVDRFLERLSTGKVDRDRALELCKANESPAARIFALIVKAWGQPGATIRQNLSFDAAGEVVEMKRNLRVLNGMATMGPLLGLLGTVVGIIQSFDALGGRVGPARGEALAQGISLALVATAFGLVIAIIAVAAYYYLLNRVDVLVRELDERARQVVELICAEAIRPAALDRRHSLAPPAEPLRQETRTY